MNIDSAVPAAPIDTHLMRLSPLPSLVALVLLVLLGSSCGVQMPAHHPGLTIVGPGGGQSQAGIAVQAQARVTYDQPVEMHGAAVAEFFGIPMEGVQDVVFVLDRSGSMVEPAHGVIFSERPGTASQPTAQQPAAQQAVVQQGSPGTQTAGPTTPPPAPPVVSKIDLARDELEEALARLPDGTRLNVLFFDESLEAFAPGIVAMDPTARAHLAAFVAEATPDGPTALGPALRTALLMNPRRVVLLSDGLGNVGGDSEDILRDAREAISGGVRFDTIGLGRTHDRNLLHALATESGGLYQAP